MVRPGDSPVPLSSGRDSRAVAVGIPSELWTVRGPTANRARGKATVLIASAMTDRCHRWEPRLRERLTVYGVTERSTLEQVIGYLRFDVLVLDLSLPGLGGLEGV